MKKSKIGFLAVLFSIIAVCVVSYASTVSKMDNKLGDEYHVSVSGSKSMIDAHGTDDTAYTVARATTTTVVYLYSTTRSYIYASNTLLKFSKATGYGSKGYSITTSEIARDKNNKQVSYVHYAEAHRGITEYGDTVDELTYKNVQAQ